MATGLQEKNNEAIFEASLADADHGVLMRSARSGVEVVAREAVDEMAGTAAGRAVAALLAAAMEFAF